MAARVKELLANDELRNEMGRRAAETARRRFDARRMVSDYLDWYYEILESEGRNVSEFEPQKGS
jgi:glycosyltransferase involved in cell wall biosynthesis